jgi:membrane fusion protein (multidrug efflux system)
MHFFRTRISMGLLAAFLLLGAGCSSTHESASAPASAPAEIAVVTAVHKDIPVYGDWVGTVDGFVNADLKAQVAGTILRQDYHEGDRVHKGQLMFEIDPRPFEAALAQAEGQLAQARSQVAQASAQSMQAQATMSQANSQLLSAQAAKAQAESQLQQAQAMVAQARANQKRAQLDWEKYEPLGRQQMATRQEVDNAHQTNEAAKALVTAALAQVQTQRGAVKSALAQIENAHAGIAAARAQQSTASGAMLSAQAQVQAAQAQVETARLNLSYTRITAPIDGVAGIAKVQVGNLVGPGSEALATVSTLNPVKVFFTLTETEYLEGHERHANRALRAAAFELVLSDGSVYPEKGRFYAEDRNVDASTGALRVSTVFPNPSSALRPGQYARVRAVRYVEKDAVVIPQRAVTELQDATQVAVVGPGDKVEIRSVKLGPRVGSSWIVREGVKPGDRVVAEGVQKVHAGSVVHPVPFDEGKKSSQ